MSPRAEPSGRLARQSLVLALSGLLSRSAMLLVGFVIARAFGPEEFGRYTAAFALASTFLLFTNMGAGFWLMKLTARGDIGLDRAYGNALLVTAAMAAVAYPALLVTSRVLGYAPALRHMVALLGPVVILASFHELFSSLAQGRGRMGSIAGFRVTYALSLLVAAVWARLVDGTPELFALLALALVSVITVAWFLSTLRIVRPRLYPREIPALVRGSWLYGLASLFFVIYFRIDSVMLALLRTPREVGEYGAAYQIVELLLRVPILVSFVTLPLAFAAESPRSMLAAYAGKLRHLALLGALCSFVVFAFAGPILGVLVGGRFALAETALRVLAVALWIKFVGVAAADLLTTSERQGRRTALAGMAAVFNIAINLVLIPRLGVLGASWATVATEALLTVSLFLSVRSLRLGRVGAPVIFASAGALAAGIGVAAVLADVAGRLPATVAGLAVMVTLAVGAGILRRSDLRVLTAPIVEPVRWVSP